MIEFVKGEGFCRWNGTLMNPENCVKMFGTDDELKYLFGSYKARLLIYYTNAFEHYKKKINKTLSPLVMEYFERGMKEWEYA